MKITASGLVGAFGKFEITIEADTQEEASKQMEAALKAVVAALQKA